MIQILAMLALAGTVTTPDSSLTQRGISVELARYRAARVSDVSYDIALDVTARDTARGTVRIVFQRAQPGDAIVDFRGPVLRDLRVNGRAVTPVWNGAHVTIPGAMLRAGENEITATFASLIAPAGASVIRFHDTTDGADYVYTLLVPSDANQLFPCFDQPDLKARTALTLTIPHAWTAVSNGSITGSREAGATTTIIFERTQPMSTYLIAFAAGPWAHVSRTVGGRPITMYVRASRLREAESDSLIDANGRAAQWLADYFAVPFPWTKLDFVLAPAFPFGGMEHPGAIFYSENTFIFRERPTRPQLLGREATIYHEVAHQWFGDLVTMKWFDDLWLKEGFATYMAAKMQASLEPASNAWETFYLRNKPLAYGVDRTSGTTPIWQSLANLDQAKSNYGAIVYNKAPGVLKQLNYLVGDSSFRTGLHAFLTQHAYANATWRDLLSAVGAASHRSLAAWGDAYITRPGMPVIEQSRITRGTTVVAVELKQHPAQPLSGRTPWPIRGDLVVRYAGGNIEHRPYDLQGESVIVPLAHSALPPELVLASGGDNAYALVVPDAASARWLSAHVETIQDPLTRAMGWDALWELVREQRLPPREFISIAERGLTVELDEQILSAQLGHVTRAARAYLSPSERRVTMPLLESTLEANATDTSSTYGLRKPNLDALVRVATTPATLAYLNSLLDSASIVGDPLRAPTRWAIVTRLVASGYATAHTRLALEAHRDSTSEGKRLAFIAGAAMGDSATKRAYFNRYLSDSTLNEDWATASVGAFNDLDQSAVTLRYLRPALDTLPWLQRNRRIFFIGAWLDGFLGGETSPQALAIVKDFLASRHDLGPDLREKVLQAEDELERTAAIRAGPPRAAGFSPSS